MSDQNSLPEIKSYTDTSKSVVIHYQNGELKTTFPSQKDKIAWDALRHDVAYYESELNSEIFKLIE